MNFIDILKVASENQGYAAKEVRKTGYSTALSKAKKEKKDRARGVNSSSVQAFLKKKDEEEKQKQAEEKRKKAELMKLRAEQNTLGKMNNIIKRNHTKEAIFEVEGFNDASKPYSAKEDNKDADGDDGVSFTRLRTELGETKRRAAVANVKRIQVNPHFVPKEEREKSEAAAKAGDEKPSDKSSKHSSKDSKHSSKDSKHSGSKPSKHSYEKNESKESKDDKLNKRKEEVKKKRPPAPPPMSFHDLLKKAEELKNVDPAAKMGSAKKEKPKSDGEKSQEDKDKWQIKAYKYFVKTGRRHPDLDIAYAERLALQNCRYVDHPDAPQKRRRNRDPAKSSSVASEQTNSYKQSERDLVKADRSPSPHVDKYSTSKTSDSKNSTKSVDRNSASSKSSDKYSSSSKNSSSSGAKPDGSRSGSSGSRPGSSGSRPGSNGSRPGSSGSGGGRSENSSKQPRLPSMSASNSKSTSKSLPVSSSSQKGSQGSSGRSAYAEENDNVLVCGPAQDKPQQSTWDRIYGNVKKTKPKLAELVNRKRKQVIESDDEYDSEMDGFIDEEDSDLDGFIDDSDAGDVSKQIQAIFGYNRNKYRDEDDDCRDMEVGFAQIQREEKRSAKLGLQEDLEDMRLEQEELKRKAMLKKQHAKKSKRR